jgi:choline monooxygenase
MNDSLSNILALYDQDAALEEAYTIPAAWYVDERIGRLERDHVFCGNWIAVGRTDQAAAPGQFFTFDLAGEPLIVVRGADNQLRAFYNVCRHHAAAVATAPCGVAQHLRCPYHGWTYGLDGSLKGTPEFAGVCNFDRAENGLVPIQVAIWESFIFVNLAEEAPGLEDFLGDLPQRLAPLAIRNLSFLSARVIRWPATGRFTSIITSMAAITFRTCTKRSTACCSTANTRLKMECTMCCSRARWWRLKTPPSGIREPAIALTTTGSILIS